VRIDDVTADPRYGRNAPYSGTPPGHLPVCSYLAVPVIAGPGKVLGGLVFGHEARGVFQPRHERLVIGIADWAAVALENARLYQEAQQASRTKDEFLATVSHELRTPLNAILGWSHMLRGGLLKPPMTRRAIENIERNARAQAQLIEDLLDVSRIVSGNLEIRMEPVDLLRVISAAVDVIRPAARARDLDVQVHIDDAAREVTGDAARLQQVLWNLLSNAVKFTPAHGQVEVRLDRLDDEACISVRDTGQGLSAEFLPQAFDRFRQQQGDATRAHGGLGLGLSIVKYLTEAHGGAVAVHSDGEGRGATFQVTLPLRRERLGQGGQGTPPQTEVTEDVGRGPRALAGLRLLVVDDEPDGREVLRVMLDSQGADVLAVASAAEALDAIGTESFDRLLADIGMPGCDGYSLMEAVRARPKEEGGDLAAIAVTAYVGERERERAFAAGYQAHVTKPVDFDRLILRILDVMAARDAARRPSAT
jgi:signal transduction histidine kinase/CheY-like chemotaxis protein